MLHLFFLQWVGKTVTKFILALPSINLFFMVFLISIVLKILIFVKASPSQIVSNTNSYLSIKNVVLSYLGKFKEPVRMQNFW